MPDVKGTYMLRGLESVLYWANIHICLFFSLFFYKIRFKNFSLGKVLHEVCKFTQKVWSQMPLNFYPDL